MPNLDFPNSQNATEITTQTKPNSTEITTFHGSKILSKFQANPNQKKQDPDNQSETDFKPKNANRESSKSTKRKLENLPKKPIEKSNFATCQNQYGKQAQETKKQTQKERQSKPKTKPKGSAQSKAQRATRTRNAQRATRNAQRASRGTITSNAHSRATRNAQRTTRTRNARAGIGSGINTFRMPRAKIEYFLKPENIRKKHAKQQSASLLLMR